MLNKHRFVEFDVDIAKLRKLSTQRVESSFNHRLPGKNVKIDIICHTASPRVML